MQKTINYEECWEQLRKFIINRVNHFNDKSMDPQHGASVIFGCAYMRMMRTKMDEIELENKGSN